MSQTNRRNKRTPKKRTKKKMPEPNGAFWQHKTAEEIVAEQGKKPTWTNSLGKEKFCGLATRNWIVS
jgi:hypothetical protein